MKLTMPDLEVRRVYHHNEVANYIGEQEGSSDYDVVVLHFPRDLTTFQTSLAEYRPEEEMLLQYQVIPMTELEVQIRGLETKFNSDKQHRKRIDSIKECFLQGEPLFPVFIQQNDAQRRIIEGMHRAVALLQLGSLSLPGIPDRLSGLVRAYPTSLS